MTEKPIISIPIDDSKFKEFLKLFDEYIDKLDDLPDAWQEANKAMDESLDGVGKNIAGVKEMLAISMVQTQRIVEAIQSAIPAQQRLRRETDNSTRSMSNLHKQTVSVAEGVFTASSGLSGITKILKGFGLPGMIAAGTVATGFGLGDLALQQARAVSDTSRMASGANLSYGQFQNAQAQLSPFIANPGALLQNIAAAQWNPASYGMLSLFGVSPSESPLSAAAKIVRGAVQTLGSTHNALLPQVMFAEQLTGLSENDLISLVNQNPKDLNTAIHKMLASKLAAQQNVGKGTISSDQRLVAGWAASMNTASAKFATAVAPMNTIVQGFGNDVAKFAGAVNNMVQGVVGPNNGSVAHGGPGAPPAAIAAWKGTWFDALKYGFTGKGPSKIYPSNADSLVVRHKTASIAADLFSKMVLGHPYAFPQSYNFSAPAKKYGISAALLSALAQDESGMNKNAVSPKGAQGLFQFMPSVAKSLGINPFDPGEAAYGAAYEISGYLKKYRGNLQQAIAAYNWGPTNLDADIKRHGSQWLSFAPFETQNEVAKILRLLAKNNSTKQRVSLEISNSTSARVAMSANSAAY